MSSVRGHRWHFWHTHTHWRFPQNQKFSVQLKQFWRSFIHELDFCSDDIFFSILPIKIWIMYFISLPNWPNFDRLLFLTHKWVSSSSSAAINILCNAQGTGALTPRWLREAASKWDVQKWGHKWQFSEIAGSPKTHAQSWCVTVGSIRQVKAGSSVTWETERLR